MIMKNVLARFYFFKYRELFSFEVFLFKFNLNILQRTKEILYFLWFLMVKYQHSFHFKLDSIFQQSPLFRVRWDITSHWYATSQLHIHLLHPLPGNLMAPGLRLNQSRDFMEDPSLRPPYSSLASKTQTKATTHVLSRTFTVQTVLSSL